MYEKKKMISVEIESFSQKCLFSLMLDQFWRLCGVRRYLADGTNHVDSPYE